MNNSHIRGGTIPMPHRPLSRRERDQIDDAFDRFEIAERVKPSVIPLDSSLFSRLVRWAFRSRP